MQATQPVPHPLEVNSSIVSQDPAFETTTVLYDKKTSGQFVYELTKQQMYTIILITKQYMYVYDIHVDVCVVVHVYVYVVVQLAKFYVYFVGNISTLLTQMTSVIDPSLHLLKYDGNFSKTSPPVSAFGYDINDFTTVCR